MRRTIANLFKRRALSRPAIFFVHVPKTAGTSFRTAFENSMGCDSQLCFDYGEQSPKTSGIVRSYIYKRQDPWRFRNEWEKHEYAFLSGHVPVAKYVDWFGAPYSVTILRDPVQRLISAYEHAVRLQGYQGDFPSFYRKTANQNLQARLLHAVDFEALGGLGLTERYGESLQVINDSFGFDLQVQAVNLGRKSIDNAYSLPEEQELEIIELNAKDIELYRRAFLVFDQRANLASAGLPFTHSKITHVDSERVHGWAWWGGACAQQSDEPVEVEVLRNGEVVESVVAKQFCHPLGWVKAPRGGFVAFRSKHACRPGDTLECRVLRTGEYISAFNDHRVPSS